MNQRLVEGRLSIAFTLCIAFGATASITSGIAWGHWKGTLDQCVDKNCSCIFYAVNTPNYFIGGPTAPCIWVTFGPLIYVLFSIGFACFHGFRVLFGSKQTVTRSVATKNELGEPVIMQTIIEEGTISHLPRAFWISGAVLASFFTVYALAHFSVYIDGYFKTCNQYREALIKQLGVHGTIIPVIYSRLTCTAIYDFMDYIQPDTGNAQREGFINTAADLITGIVCSFFAWLSFLYSTIIYIMFAKKKV